jgi:hypothetical protein
VPSSLSWYSPVTSTHQRFKGTRQNGLNLLPFPSRVATGFTRRGAEDPVEEGIAARRRRTSAPTRSVELISATGTTGERFVFGVFTEGLQFSQTSDGLLAGGAEGPLMADASREEDDDDQGDVGLGKKGFSSAQVFGHSWRPASTTWMWVSKCRTDGGKKIPATPDEIRQLWHLVRIVSSAEISPLLKRSYAQVANFDKL